MHGMANAVATFYLEQNGITSQDRINDILGGFDLDKPVYEQHLYPGDTLFQYIRNPSMNDLNPNSGNWFCLLGATESGVGIASGLSGRRFHRFKVLAGLVALEGTAAPKDMDWILSLGGKGGQTQLYVPPLLINRIRAVAPY